MIMSRWVLIPCLLLVCGPVHAKSIDDLYGRIVSDANAGRPLVVTVHVALCDNDSQGLYVKNHSICRGDSPGSNLYWATSGGLRTVMDASPFSSVTYEKEPGDVLAARGVWHRRLPATKGLASRGLEKDLDVYVVGLAYRGSRIADAMEDFLHALGHDTAPSVTLPDGTSLSYGGAGHVTGYIGHNYLMDVIDQGPVLSAADGTSTSHKASFALACMSDSYLRETLDRPNGHIMVLNRHFTYPGAWTVRGIVRGLVTGRNHKGIHYLASKFFSKGKGKPLSAILGAFTHG
jgi:hypothetical protein